MLIKVTLAGGLSAWMGSHYSDVMKGAMTSEITNLTIVYSTDYSGADQRKHQSSASLAFVRGIHRWPVNSPQKWPVTRKMFQSNNVIMDRTALSYDLSVLMLLTFVAVHRANTPEYTKGPHHWSFETIQQSSVAFWFHHTDVIMGTMTFQITSFTSVYSTVYSGANQRNHQSPASLAFVRGIHWWPVNSPHKGPVTRKMFPFDDVIMVIAPVPLN